MYSYLVLSNYFYFCDFLVGLREERNIIPGYFEG